MQDSAISRSLLEVQPETHQEPRLPVAVVMRPKLVLSMFRLGLPKFGWFRTLTASTRNSNSFVSVILTRLIRFMSNRDWRPLDPFQAEIADLSWRGIHQKKLALGIGNRLVAELAVESVQRLTPATRWIRDLLEATK